MSLFILLQFFVSSKIKYAIMIDAGSSGTRAHCFLWEKSRGVPQVQPARDPITKEIWLIKSKIPLKKANKNSELISQIFDPIIQYYSQRIPPKFLIKTRIFVYATAGLRLLDETQQYYVMNQTYSYLLKKSPFKIKPRYVRVISGIEEGIYGWISANHLKNRFCRNCNTFGALDMGGASNQIAVQIDSSSIPSPYSHIINLGFKRVHLFAHSYLGYGQTEALKTALDYYLTNHISQISENSSTIQNLEPFPCFNKGYQKERKGIQINSKGDWEKCCSLANDALLSDSAFTSVKVPHDTKEYIAMASFFYTNDFLKLRQNSTLKELKEAGEKQLIKTIQIIHMYLHFVGMLHINTPF